MKKCAYKIAKAAQVSLALLALAPVTSAFGQSDGDLCRRFEGLKDGASLILDTGKTWQVASRRNSMETTQIGFSSAKGDLSQHLTNDKPGYSVRWSGAVQRGPIQCGGYKVVHVTVEANTISYVPTKGTITNLSAEAIEEAIVRRMSGKATKEDLQRLRDYYAENGDLMQAKKLLEESLLLK